MYLDNAATTPVDPDVRAAMEPYFSESFANPGSSHRLGKKAARAVEDARMRVAKILAAHPDQIIFTGSATESINLALKGVAFAKGKGHILTSTAEHHSVLATCTYLEQMGFTITYLPVNKDGIVTAEQVREAITDDTILVSIIYANNEIGSINDIAAIGKTCKEQGVLLHTDACQAGALDLNVSKLGVDLLTLNGSKLYGPKGVGTLYKGDAAKLVPLIHGGDQEQGLRAGTHNVPAIIGFAKALELHRTVDWERIHVLRDELIAKLLHIPGTELNGHPTKRVANNVNITFEGIDGSQLLELLDEADMHASMGSACTTHKLEPSHVITAIGTAAHKAHGAIRFTLSKHTTEEDIRAIAQVVSKSVQDLRCKTPLRVIS